MDIDMLNLLIVNILNLFTEKPKAEQIMYFENFDLEHIVTPVDVDRLEKLLEQAGYEPGKRNFVVNEFRYGLNLECQGKIEGRKVSPNLKLRVGSKIELWNKMMVEVRDKRFAGPFKDPPFEEFIQSPVGLVPKDNAKKTRLIFYLSYPRDGRWTSVNARIPKEKATVKYPELDDAIKICIKAGKSCKMSKSDISRALRNVPLNSEQWVLLVMRVQHPESGEWFYFVDKCLPFGSSISCAIFQAISDAIAFMVRFRTSEDLVNYLDDYFFAALVQAWCDRQAQIFMEICKDIGLPVAIEKTFWGSTLMTFLGLLLDSEKEIVCVPLEKLNKALEMIDYFLDRTRKKATVKQFQKLCGYLNFLCRAIVPGRAFVRHLYAINSNKLKAHHHVRITQENRLDLMIWKQFLNSQDAYCRPFMDFVLVDAIQIDMYSDASRNFVLGFGAYCGTEWSYGKWNYDFMVKC